MHDNLQMKSAPCDKMLREETGAILAEEFRGLK